MTHRMHMALAMVLGAVACSSPDDTSGDLHLELVQAPTNITPGTAVPQSLIVRVLNGDSQGVPGVPVNWSVATGGGSVTPAADTSGADGLATAQWTAGLAVGEQQVGVTIYDQPALRITVNGAALKADRIAVSYRNGCGIDGGATWCWAYTFFSGPTATTWRVLPQVQATDVAFSGAYVCVLDAAGATYCHSTFDNSPPEAYFTIPNLPPLRTVSGGPYFCGLAVADNTPWCWSHGNLVGEQVSASLQLASVSASDGGACGLTTAGAAWCWDPAGAPVAVPGGHAFRTISTQYYSTCAIEGAASLFCWSPDAAPSRVAGVSPTLISVGTFDESLLNANGATVFNLAAGVTGGFLLVPNSALVLPTRALADHCAIASDRTVYCTSSYDYQNVQQPFTWAAVPAPAP